MAVGKLGLLKRLTSRSGSLIQAHKQRLTAHNGTAGSARGASRAACPRRSANHTHGPRGRRQGSPTHPVSRREARTHSPFGRRQGHGFHRYGAERSILDNGASQDRHYGQSSFCTDRLPEPTPGGCSSDARNQWVEGSLRLNAPSHPSRKRLRDAEPAKVPPFGPHVGNTIDRSRARTRDPEGSETSEDGCGFAKQYADLDDIALRGEGGDGRQRRDFFIAGLAEDAVGTPKQRTNLRLCPALRCGRSRRGCFACVRQGKVVNAHKAAALPAPSRQSAQIV